MPDVVDTNERSILVPCIMSVHERHQVTEAPCSELRALKYNKRQPYAANVPNLAVLSIADSMDEAIDRTTAVRRLRHGS